MVKLKFWWLPLISSILVLVALLTPAWIFPGITGSAYIWSWAGYMEISGSEIGFIFYDNPVYLIPGLIVTLLQVIILIMSILSILFIKKEKKKPTIIINIISAILLILCSVGFMIGIALFAETWIGKVIIGPGLIIPFISAALDIIIAVFAKKKIG